VELISDDFVIFCYHTGRDLFQLKDGETVWIAPHGRCDMCDNWFHFRALQTPPGKSAPSYPVRYNGYTCKPCYKDLMGK